MYNKNLARRHAPGLLFVRRVTAFCPAADPECHKQRQTYLQGQLTGVDQLTQTAQHFILDPIPEAALQGHPFICHAHRQHHCCTPALVLVLPVSTCISHNSVSYADFSDQTVMTRSMSGCLQMLFMLTMSIIYEMQHNLSLFASYVLSKHCLDSQTCIQIGVSVFLFARTKT